MSISVLMSVYKSEKPAYLDMSLRSVWDDQSLKPDEIVLVKDGPLGSELDSVVDKWKTILDDKLILIANVENLGLTKSLNKAIAASHGKYLARMDSDDISLPDRFAKQKDFMESHTEIDVVGGGLQEIDENGNWGAERLYPSDSSGMKEYIVKANPIAHPTAFIRKSVFDNGYKYDEKYRKNQDLKLWFDLLKSNHQLANIPEVLLYFRRTSDTYLKRKSKESIRSEVKIYLKGITEFYGSYNWRIIYPILRYAVKSMPSSVNSFVYKYLFKKNNS